MLTFLLKIKRCNFFISRKHYFSAAKLGIQWHANIYELDGNKRKKFSRNWKIILVFVSQKKHDLRKYIGLWLRYERNHFCMKYFLLKLICGEHLTVHITWNHLGLFDFKTFSNIHYLVRVHWAELQYIFSICGLSGADVWKVYSPIQNLVHLMK